ncbi:AAA family ATPase [Campylobacter jejuni]|nr:AAA family ATPase [Campylobacter jejuni]MBX0797366.1 AAA family ATPase [Campylobacter jejuni]MBX0969547.1 AAA family ATPase [Campylobacter jejuni]MBX1002308.1 AAA family ATPase [Campylobacter jejuni]MBX1106393.1 AAA family ATPase [Campylobacter jejuni]
MITNLKIENFKSISDYNFEFKPLTILAGANSSGKSSIIQSILFYSYCSSANIYLEKYLDNFGNVENLLYFKETKDKKIKITPSINDKQLPSLVSNDTCDGWQKLENNTLAFEKDLFHLCSNRVGQENSVKIHQTLRSGNTGEYLFGFYEEYKNQALKNTELISSEDSDTLSMQVRFWMEKILDLKIEPITQKIDTNNIRVYYSNYQEGIELLPFNLGAGISYLAKILILGLSLDKGNLLIIENPEVHLHPKAIAKLADFFVFLINAGIQVILETHSEHILNKIRWNVFKKNIPSNNVKIYYRNNAEEEFIDLNINEKGRYTDKNNDIVEFPKGFFDSDLNELLEMM